MGKVMVSGILGVVLAAVAITLLVFCVRRTISSKKALFGGDFLGRWALEAFLFIYFYQKFFS